MMRYHEQTSPFLLVVGLIPFDFPNKTKEPEMLIFQAFLALQQQGMRESNSCRFQCKIDPLSPNTDVF